MLSKGSQSDHVLWPTCCNSETRVEHACFQRLHGVQGESKYGAFSSTPKRLSLCLSLVAALV
jgi:hypothetical protein